MSQGYAERQDDLPPRRHSRYQAPPRRRRRGSTWRWGPGWIWVASLIAAMVVAAGAVTGIEIVKHESPAPQPEATLTDPALSIKGVSSIAFSPDGTTLAAGDSNGTTYLWDVASRHLAMSLPDPQDSGGVSSVAFNPNGTMLAAGDLNGSTYLWDPASGQQIGTLTDPPFSGNPGVTAVAFSPDGTTLATSGGGLYLWDIATKRRISTMSVYTVFATAAAMSPNGKILAEATTGGSLIRLWDTATARLTGTLTNPGGGIAIDQFGQNQGLVMNSLAFSPDGSMLAAGVFNGTTYLWSLAKSQVIAKLVDPGGNNDVQSVAFSPNGKTLITGDRNGSVYFWNAVAATGLISPTATLTVAGDKGVNAVAFSPDGATVAMACANDKTYLWHTPPEAAPGA